MKEEIIVSGRMNEGIDPYLNIWHWEIPIYLFLGGLAAGLIFFSALYSLLGKESQYKTAVKSASILAPFAIILGLVALFLDLKHKLFFWQLYTTIRLESPMSWGAWTLLIITPLSFAWVATFLKDLFPVINWDKSFYARMLRMVLKPVEQEQNWDWKYKIFRVLEAWIIRNKKLYAWVLIYYAVILGVYTGILLSAFNARPLWNTSILGPLFLVSGLSTAAATIMWMSSDHKERIMFSKIDLILIGIELFLIAHLFMGFRAGPEVQVEAAKLFLGGNFTMMFWVFVVGIGLILPAIFEVFELFGKKVPVFIPAILILFGGVMFRIIMVDAGQLVRYLY
jgi:protein NrfD